VIHYQGTPLTPRSELLKLPGRCFCLPFSDPRDLLPCLEIGASVMGDNGAFGVHTKGGVLDVPGYYRWLGPWLRPPHWAVVPDRIGGTVEEQRAMTAGWPYARSLGAPVWHLHLALDYLIELAETWPRICFGSSAAFWNPRSEEWRRRIDEAWNALSRRGLLPWVHMLRAMAQASRGPWPFASADSVNLARNFKDYARPVEETADRIEQRNPPALWKDTAVPMMEIV
jgi:hypothetical protein